MTSTITRVALSAALTLALTSFAMAKDRGGSGWLGGWCNPGHPGSHPAAPGPTAGAGFPFLLAAGAFLVYRRRRQRLG